MIVFRLTMIGALCHLAGWWVGGCAVSVAQSQTSDAGPVKQPSLPVVALEALNDGQDLERIAQLASAIRGIEASVWGDAPCSLFDGPHYHGSHPTGGRVIKVAVVPSGWIFENIESPTLSASTIGYYFRDMIRVESRVTNGRMVSILQHELGHALGLVHTESETLMNPTPQNTWRLSAKSREALATKCR